MRLDPATRHTVSGSARSPSSPAAPPASARPPPLRLQAGFTVYAVARRVERMAASTRRGVHTVRDGRHRRRLDGRGRRADHRRAGPHRRPGQQRRLRLLRRGRGRADRRGAAPVRGQRVRPGPARPSSSRRTCASSGRAGSSTSPRSAARSTSRSARGTTPRSSRWRASATACAWSCAPFGIDVVLIEPGPIITEWNAIARDSLRRAVRRTAPTQDLAHRMAVMFEAESRHPAG